MDLGLILNSNKEKQNMKRAKITTRVFFCIGLITLISCNEMDPVPTNQYTDATFWQSAENAETVVNMAYNQMFNSDKMWNDEALSDNAFEGRSNTAQRAMRNGTADPTLGRFATEWKEAYEGIKTCHIFLQYVDNVPDMDPALIEKRKAEVRFIRAFLYFRLVYFYGNIPFFTQDITLEESKTISRTPKADVLLFIHRELDEIMAILPSKNGLPADDNGRITKGAACAFQARAYLYESNWEKVSDYTNRLINNQAEYGTYSLFSDYAGLFSAANEYNHEVILDYGYVPSLKTWSKFYDMAPISAGARLNAFAPLQGLVDSYLLLNGKSIHDDSIYDDNTPYINRDPRLSATIVYHGSEWELFDGSKKTIYIKPGTGETENEKLDLYVSASANSTSTGYYTKKYYDIKATTTFDAGLNIILFRYADILLMYAEAMFETGKMNQTIWNQTIRLIRERAGFTLAGALDFPSAISSDDLRKVIRNERRSELAMEGLRYFDIVRWKAGADYLHGYVYGAKFGNSNTVYLRLDNRQFNENRDYLWAVPQAQLDLNPNLAPQNPGYAN